MRSIISMLLISISTVFFGCSDNGNASFENEVESITMIIGQEMNVEEGDKVITGEDTVINVVHEVDSSIKKVTLLSGSAELIRGSYVVVN